MQALLNLLWRSRLVLFWLGLQVLSLSWYIASVEALRLQWVRFWEAGTVLFHRGLSWLLRPVVALKHYRELQEQNAHLLEALAQKMEACGPASIPLRVWGRLIPEKPYEFIPVEGLYQTVHARKNYLLIEGGARQGLYPGLCVIGTQGMVGFIAETTATYSRVLPLFDEDVHMAVQLAQSGYLGLTSWRGLRTFNELEVLYVPLYARVEVGEEVWSAPQSTLAPGGLRLGLVVKAIPEPLQGFQRLVVRTYADWFRLGPLYAIKPKHPPS